MRKENLANDEYYHVYNRGVDKRTIFLDHEDVARFYQCMIDFNTENITGGVRGLGYKDRRETTLEDMNPLVEIVAYCLNPNHFHLILKQVADYGVSKFLMRVAGGYSRHFNIKYKRSGSLFQGRFKASHIESNNYLTYVSAYVNLNNKVHKLGYPVPESKGIVDLPFNSRGKRVIYSSWREYTDKSINGICSKDIILGQFKTLQQYKIFAKKALQEMQKNKLKRKEIEEILFE